MTALPARYKYLTEDPAAPALVQEFLKMIGTIERAGGANNPTIIAWADEVARESATTYNQWAADWYNKDSVPWCGLAQAVAAVRSAGGRPERMPPKNYLSAAAWTAFGNPVQFRGREGLRLHEIFVGDVAIFTRAGGNHVATIVGVTKDGNYVVCVGGNQDDAVNIKQFPVSRLYAVRRPPYNQQPAGARHVRVTSSGIVSTREG